MFHYPVTIGEIHAFMDQPIERGILKEAVNELEELGKVFNVDGYYSISNEASFVQRRIEGNRRAVHLLRIAEKIGRRLYCFPFVRAVGVSGSLSKNYADVDADIDFFIITKRNRLWIARTLLHGLKKISFLFGRQDWYCMNYFIDEESLLIAEKNVFTATEVVTLKPVAGNQTIRAFFEANNWTRHFLPNHQTVHLSAQPVRDPWYKRMVEFIFDNRAGASLDSRLMRVTARRWARKEAQHKMNSKGNPLALVAEQHFARPNPGHFQQKILHSFKERTNSFEQSADLNPVFSAAR